MEDSAIPSFSVRWARRWGIALTAGALLPQGTFFWQARVMFIWDLLSRDEPELFLVTLALLILGVYAVFMLPRQASARAFPIIALGGVVGSAFLGIQAAERGSRAILLETEQLQCLLLLGFGGALIAAGNHLRKARISVRARVLCGVGGVIAIGFFLLPFGRRSLISQSLRESFWLESPHVATTLLAVLLYCTLGLVSAFRSQSGSEPAMSLMVRIILVAAPTVPLAGEIIREGGRIPFWVIALGIRHFLVLYGMFGLLATGFVEWFREPE